jgi:hypothetical protein
MVRFSYINDKVEYTILDEESKYIRYINKEVESINQLILKIFKLNELWSNCNNNSIKEGLISIIVDNIEKLKVYFTVELKETGIKLTSKDVDIKNIIQK